MDLNATLKGWALAYDKQVLLKPTSQSVFCSTCLLADLPLCWRQCRPKSVIETWNRSAVPTGAYLPFPPPCTPNPPFILTLGGNQCSRLSFSSRCKRENRLRYRIPKSMEIPCMGICLLLNPTRRGELTKGGRESKGKELTLPLPRRVR